MISEILLRKHHDGTGVDRQGQPVIQVHVLQPVVMHLNKSRETGKRGFVERFGQRLLLSELSPVRGGVKTHYSPSPPDEKESGRVSA